VVSPVRLGFQGQKLVGPVDLEIKVTNLRIVRNYLPIDTASIPASLNIRHTAVRTSYLANFGTLGVVLDFPITATDYYSIYFFFFLLTAIGLSPGGSSTVHIYTQTYIERYKTNNT
jgi:hypothetical protein